MRSAASNLGQFRIDNDSAYQATSGGDVEAWITSVPPTRATAKKK